MAKKAMCEIKMYNSAIETLIEDINHELEVVEFGNADSETCSLNFTLDTFEIRLKNATEPWDLQKEHVAKLVDIVLNEGKNLHDAYDLAIGYLKTLFDNVPGYKYYPLDNSN